MSGVSGFVVELGVSCVEQSLDFYVEKLGCSVVESVVDGNGRKIWSEIDFLGTRVMLQDIGLLSAEIPGIAASDLTNQFALVMRVGSKETAKLLLKSLQVSSVILNSEPVETDYGSYEFSVLDPDGFVVLIAGRD